MYAMERDGLLEALHGGMFEAPLWDTFLRKLAGHMNAASVTLNFRPSDGDAVIALHVGLPATAAESPLPYEAMRVDRIYALADLLDLGDARQQAYYRDVLQPQGLAHQLSVRVAEPSGVNAWLTCAGGRSLGASAGALLRGLVPHLRIALQTFIALEREKQRFSVAAEAFGRLNFGWLTLDSRCRIIDMTPYATLLFQRSNLLRKDRYGRLVPASRTIDRELTRLVDDFAKGRSQTPQAINLSRDPWTDILVAPIQQRAVSAGTTAVAIVYLSGDRNSQAERGAQIAGLFGLAPSEARMAWAMAQGMSITEAGAAHGLTVETARNYSKRIYAKTGARGHADLVRIVLTSVLAIA